MATASKNALPLKYRAEHLAVAPAQVLQVKIGGARKVVLCGIMTAAGVSHTIAGLIRVNGEKDTLPFGCTAFQPMSLLLDGDDDSRLIEELEITVVFCNPNPAELVVSYGDVTAPMLSA